MKNRAEIAGVVKSLKANLFSPVVFAETGEEAKRLVLDLIPVGARVGLGASTSVRQIGLLRALQARGNEVLDFYRRPDLPFGDAMRWSLYNADVFLTSLNAVTRDGKLVNIDGSGNRVAGTIFGPQKVVLLVGQNKIVATVDEALDRIKNVISPYHNMVRGRKVPCAKTGRCSDCKSPDRSCRVTVIMEKQPRYSSIAIILVGEDLGLGWDPAWPEERKNKIGSIYRKITLEVGAK